MKYTINGFDQKTFFEYGLNLTDSFLLRWMVDFSSSDNMTKIYHDGKIYFWVKYSAIIEEFPCLEISTTKGIAKRFSKFVECGLMENYTKKDESGTYSCYRIVSDKFLPLITSTPLAQKSSPLPPELLPVTTGVPTPLPPELLPKDPSTNNPITKTHKNTISAEIVRTTKKTKSPEQQQKDDRLKSDYQTVINTIVKNNYPINPDQKLSGYIYNTLKREGVDRTVRAVNNIFQDDWQKANGYPGLTLMFIKADKFTRYANIKSEKANFDDIAERVKKNKIEDEERQKSGVKQDIPIISF